MSYYEHQTFTVSWHIGKHQQKFLIYNYMLKSGLRDFTVNSLQHELLIYRPLIVQQLKELKREKKIIIIPRGRENNKVAIYRLVNEHVRTFN